MQELESGKIETKYTNMGISFLKEGEGEIYCLYAGFTENVLIKCNSPFNLSLFYLSNWKDSGQKVFLGNNIRHQLHIYYNKEQ